MRIPKTMLQWQDLAETRLKLILKKAQKSPTLVRMGPYPPWMAHLKLVGEGVMSQLNSEYRDKNYPTDILSFPAGGPFWEKGILGELIICLPTMKKQALKLHHSPIVELEVLLVHGVLHLLGFDHERSQQDAKKMAAWEKRLLLLSKGNRSSGLRASAGLIARTDSDMNDE